MAAQFDLRIERVDGNRFRARLIDSPNPGVVVEFSSPFSEEELERLRRFVENPRREVERRAAIDWRLLAKQMGKELFKAVFSGPVLEAWREERSRARALGHRLVIRLNLADPELEMWPWEYLRDRGRFLSVSSQTPIARLPEIALVTRPLPVHYPLRILGVISAPQDCRPLAGDVEWRHLQEVLASLQARNIVDLELLVPPTLEALNARLSKTDRPCHVLHFIGHGGFEWGSLEGALYFEDGSKRADPVTGEELGTVLHDRSLRLAVLNACLGARGNSSDPFASVAQSLFRYGVEAVVGMKYSVEDSFAIAFSRVLFERLAGGEPLDVALSEARLALYSQRFKVEWGNPVLYLRSSGGIFQIEAVSEEIGKPSKDPPPPGRKRAIQAVAVVFGIALLVTAALNWGGNMSKHGVVPDLKPATLLEAMPELPSPPSDPRCPSAKGLDLRFVLIEPEASASLEPYCMSVFETRISEWAKVMGLKEPPQDQRDIPVGGISWDDTQRFFGILNASNPGAEFVLPSQAQWLYGARAGGQDDFSFGDDPEQLHYYGNCKGKDGKEGVTRVGMFRANRFGLYDMHGNVWEWVSDAGEVDRKGRIKRYRMGGSFNIQARHCGVEEFGFSPPGSDKSDFGFRIVRKPVFPAENKRAAQGPPSNPQP